MRPRLACPGWDAARSEVERCIADPGPPQAGTVPGLQRTATQSSVRRLRKLICVRCAAPGTRERENQPAGVRKWRGGGVPVSGLLFTGSCATAARGGDTRIEIRGGRFPRSRLSPRCAGSAGMSEREATCECRNGSRFLTFTGIYRQLCDGNVWRVTRGQKRVEDARRRAYDPAGPSFFAKFCEKRWIAPQLGLARVAHRNAPQVL
jgi:hypothetical protein